MRKLMWTTIGFSACCAALAYGLEMGWMILLFLLTAGISLWKRRKQGICVMLGLLLGFGWFLGFEKVYMEPALQYDEKTIASSIIVTDYPQETDYGMAVDGRIILEGKSYRIHLYLNGEDSIRPGQRLEGNWKLRYTPPGGKRSFDYYAGKGIFLLGYQRGELAVSESEEGFYPAVLAQRIKDTLRLVFPKDVFPFIQALLLGDGSELSYELDTAFKISGIRHIIAVSGLHVSILFTFLSTITFKKRFLTAFVAFPVLGLFAAVAGFTPSVIRACIMIGLMILAQMGNREYDSPTALSFAVLVMLLCNPLVITSVSFQLSVGCVAGILLFNEPISSYLKEKFGNPKGKDVKARLKRWAISSVSVTISAMSLTTPLSACYFGAVSLVGVLTNLLTLWVVTWIFIGTALVCLACLLSGAAGAALAWVASWTARYVMGVARALSKIPLAAVYTESPYVVIWLVFAYGLLGVFLLSHKKRPGKLLLWGTGGLILALLLSYGEPLLDDTRITVLDVGQGQSILLQSQGRTYLVDCGGDSGTMAADIAAQTLLSQGITRLDGIVVTHTDADHAAGVPNLLTRIPADLVFLPVTGDPAVIGEIECLAPVAAVSEPVKISFGTSEMTVFGPVFLEDENENSLCVLFDTENCDILITGDRGNLGEFMLVREQELPQVDVLIAGHHGSKYATTEVLLQAVRPATVVISAGKDNPYGHPAPETLERIAKYGCTVLRTDLHGTITIRR